MLTGLALAVLAGGCWALGAQPRGWWPLLPVGVAVLTVALHGQALRRRLIVGVVTGLVFYGSTLGWLTDFALVGYVGITVVESLMLAMAVGLVPTAGHGRWAGGWWALPAGLAVLDAAQTRFPFNGFPLPALVHSQVDGPFAWAAPIGGSLLVTAAAAAAGVGLAAIVLTAGRARLTVVGAAVLVAGLPPLVGAVVRTEPAGTLDTAVVQGGGPRGLRAVFTDPQNTTDRQFAVAEQITGTPDVVLLPETVISVDGSVAGSAGDARAAGLARSLDAAVVVGVVERQGPGFRNAAVLWSPDGRISGRYEKEHRVPFGEYLPARDLLERLTDLTALVPRDAIPGQGIAVLESSSGTLGVVISYEVLFADRVREAVLAGGEVVLVPTNAASYVTEDVPAIEVAGARMRALEFGRAVVQSAPTGYSVVVDPDGTVVSRSPLGDAALLRETVPLRTGLTPYAHTGDAPTFGLAVLALLIGPLRLRIGRAVR
ncbi:apolipoprotein N-acyltransferase [Pseudonocardia sp. KRD-184]|uniref:Apolipoprotein N-acyltransferase n=2 Tax=Pseudonocardia oceani TaxID=2792013 RepID=A0ABS6U2X6_9PSEU|nr:apolipoprotein N-acyltransferase [Pseudonocardia oceani]MBW0098208.1 apolipoprotein N-acyltransferase [Pseudonocardia oceani]MBW0124803.1 apolipoprotein N-acyltransferase [Pseudonocardia oceani]MBW0126580.1 apolipoprotein N-acyltransferase [Pseudonocardia oceani]